MAFPENTVNDTGIKHIWDKVTTALSGKVDKVSGKGLSTNDYTTAEKEKLSGIEAGAQVNAVTSVAGKTGAVTLDKADVGLGNVDNTSDASKPISTATQNALDTKADTSEVAGTQTVSGNPITLTDASETYAQGLTVELEPKQDLHGYDFPWVGGAGKNKLPMTVANLKSWNTSGTWSGNVYSIYNTTIEIITDETNVNVHGLKINTGSGGASDVVIFKLSSNSQTFHTGDIISGCPTGGATNKYMLNIGGTDDSDIGNGGVCSSDRVGVMNLDIFSGVQLTNSMWYPMVSTEGGTFAPWENICPISGYEGVEVEDVGFNQWDEEWEVGGYDGDTGAKNNVTTKMRNKNPIDIHAYDSLYVYLPSNLTNDIQIYYYDKNMVYMGKSSWLYKGVFSKLLNAYYMNFQMADVYGTTYNHDISINYPSTDTDYHPYQSRTASVTFGQTVMGGKVDVTDGGTDDAMDTIDLGNLSWARSTSYANPFFFANISDRKTGGEYDYNPRSSAYRFDAINKTAGKFGNNGENGTFAFQGENTQVFIRNDAYTDATAFKTAMTGQTICYEKATPTTLDTPKADFKLLQDTNNLTTNGTTITLDYIPNNSIGDAVKASEEYTDRAVERVAPKATLIDTWMISEEADTISVDLSSYDCNFFLLEYLFQSKRGTTLIPRPQGGSFSASVVTYNNGTPYYIELDYNPTTKELAYTSNVTSQFGILAIYTI